MLRFFTPQQYFHLLLEIFNFNYAVKNIIIELVYKVFEKIFYFGCRLKLENFKYKLTRRFIMAGILSGSSTSIWEPFSILVGFVSLISAIFFFLYKYKIIDIGGIMITDEFFLIYFPTLILISGIMHLLSTIGVFGMGGN